MMTPFTVKYLDLRRDQDEPEAIDSTIRAGVEFAGTNLWVLMFAVLIASIGLNVNSTAAIIGAMLISPLMGPIIGIGYGAGINDFGLIRLAVRNLFIFALLSLIASTLYFLITPLSEAHSELLARTSPTIWDVLVAFFGGGAGIVAMTRKNKSPVIPGVAIATALMPPLATAGYGLASGHSAYFFGALYLFIIDGVFIAFSTLVFVKILKLPQRGRLNEARNVWILAAVILTMLPSLYLAYKLVKEEFFVTSATRFVEDLEKDRNLIVLGKTFDPRNKKIDLIVSGNSLPEKNALRSRLASFGLGDASIDLRTLGNEQQKRSLLKEQPQQDLSVNLLKALESKNQRISELERKIEVTRAIEAEQENAYREITALFPTVDRFLLGRGVRQDGSGEKPALLALVGSRKPLSEKDKARLRSWLVVRFNETDLHIDFESPKPVKKRRK